MKLKTFCVAYDLISENSDYTDIEEKMTELNGKRI